MRNNAVKNRVVVLALIFGLTPLVRALDIKKSTSKPTIDGEVTQQEWQMMHQELKYVATKNGSSQTVKNKTHVYTHYDQDNLYAAFVCFDDNMDKIRKRISALESRDTSIWNDDCVEVLLDPLGSQTDFYHFVVNSNGIFYDAFNGDSTWDVDLEIAAKTYEDKWVVEMAIPFAAFEIIPSGGEVWRGNFCREQKFHNEDSSLFLLPSPFLSDPATFGLLQFKQETETPVAVQVKRLWEKSNPSVHVAIENKLTAAQKIRVSVLNTTNETLFASTSELLNLPGNQTQEIVLPYKTSEEAQNIELLVLNESDNTILYRNHFSLLAKTDSDLSKKVWNIAAPLYEELLSEQANINDGAMAWIPAIKFNKMRLIAKQFAFPFQRYDVFKTYAKNKLRAFTQSDTLFSPRYNRVALSRKYGMDNILFVNPKNGSKGKIPFGKKYNEPFWPDPIAIESIIQVADNGLQEAGDVIWGISLGDEVEKKILTTGVQLWSDYSKEDYPFIHQANEEVKAHYGYGKYGIPEGKYDDNPYRWIAYRRWSYDQIVKISEKIYEKVKSISPATKVISNDWVSFHNPANYRDIKSDIFTHQLYPRRNKDRARIGFLSKLNYDLSGKKTFWAMLHSENYAANFNEMEVLELHSQAVRNGASGFHIYPIDTLNRLKCRNSLFFEQYAAPRRWALQMEIIKFMSQSKRLKFPTPDFAIFMSTDSHCAFPFGKESYEVESAYTFLGPNAGSYFSFIDDHLIERDPTIFSQYKAIYVPLGNYMKPALAQALLTYVEQGGTIISGDPHIFSFSPDGSSIKFFRKKLFGVNVGEKKKKSTLVYKDFTLNIYAASYQLNIQDPQQVITLANFRNGDAAITEHRYGKGKAILFAMNPFKIKALSDDGWKEFFVQFQQTHGLEVGHDIWRFQLPKTLIPEPAKKKEGTCLTNNHLVWQRNIGHDLYNENSKGSYSYSLQPDKDKEEKVTSNWIPFSQGDLTDRKSAPKAGNVDEGKGELSDWIVTWEKTEPFTITFDLSKPRSINQLKIFYSGQLPALSLHGSMDGNNWTSLNASLEKQDHTEDVIEKVLQGDFGQQQYLQLQLGERDTEKHLSLIEAEIWH